MAFLMFISQFMNTIWAYINHHESLDKRLQILESQKEYLEAKEEDIMEELKNAELQRGMKRKKEVVIWFRNVRKFLGKEQNIHKKNGEGKYFLGMHQRKCVEGMIQEVKELQEKGNLLKMNGLVVGVPSPGEKIPVTELVGKTAMENMETFVQLLKNDKVGRIGIYGKRGVGKSIIMKHIHNQLLMSDEFGFLIWVTFPKEFSIKSLQDAVASAVDLDLSKEEDTTRRAAQLSARLERMGSFVLFLDDTRDSFSLEEVGIPVPNRGNACKLVLTTQSVCVCSRIACDEKIKLNLLPEEEACELFFSTAGIQIGYNPAIEEIAKLVAQECSCLPLTIVQTAETMRGVDDIHQWRDTLNEKRGSRLKFEKFQHYLFLCAYNTVKLQYQKRSDDKLSGF